MFLSLFVTTSSHGRAYYLDYLPLPTSTYYYLLLPSTAGSHGGRHRAVARPSGSHRPYRYLLLTITTYEYPLLPTAAGSQGGPSGSHEANHKDSR